MLNKFKNILISVLVFGVVFFAYYAYAMSNHIGIVYPRNGATIRANSTFFVGNTNPNAILTVNNKPVKVYSNGAFVRVFSLNKGKNEITFISRINGEEIIRKMTLYVPPSAPPAPKTSTEFIPFDFPIVVTEDEAPLRLTPYGDRLTPIKHGMVAQAVGIINNHYKVKYNNGYAYILKSFTKVSDELKLSCQVSDRIIFDEDTKNIYIKIPLSQPTLASIFNKDNLLTVKLDGVKFDFQKTKINTEAIKSFSHSENSFTVALNAPAFYGYDYYYERDKFILKIRKPFEKYIEGKIVVIDPGHGGKETGAIGPTGVPEKDINLKISMYLKDELLKAGAHVYMTREKDNYVDLYERVKFAQAKKADILVSIHNNALPDGQNPYITHGTETYYYQPQSLLLAQFVQNNLLIQNGFNNLGIKKGSLVLTRPTNPVSILVEVGFMINPDEYSALLLPENQQKYAVGIKNGIVEYFRK